MANLNGLASIVSELRVERTNLANQLRQVDAALSVLGKLNGGSSYTKVNGAARIVSAASRRKMAQAQRARRALTRNGSQPASATASAPAKRTMSAAASRKIAAAQRARRARVKAGKKKAA
jgi:hypothetical protein